MAATSKGFANVMMRQRAQEKRMVNKAPKGFDIMLADAIDELKLNKDQIKKLGELTATRRSGLARATIGHQVWYRKAQLIEMLEVGKSYITVDEATENWVGVGD